MSATHGNPPQPPLTKGGRGERRRKAAIRLAILALRKERQRLAVDASYHDVWGSDYPAAVNASKRRALLALAIKDLEEMAEELG